MSTTTMPSQAPTRRPARLLDQKSTLAIINSRITLKPEHIGRTIKFQVQGNGTFVPKGHKYQANGVDRETAFDRTIHNLRASSFLSMLRSKDLWGKAAAAELAGDAEAAHDLFNEYLNAIQISFAVSSGVYTNGTRVQADVALVTNAAGEQQIVVQRPAIVAADVVAATTFSVEDLAGVSA